MCGVAALAMSLASCGELRNNDPIEVNQEVAYLVGEATTVSADAENKDKAQMAAGINETVSAVRSYMFEKYVALEGAKEFQIILVSMTGKSYTYGADLQKVTIDGSNDQIKSEIYRGAMVENAGMKVEKSGLYHVVFDRNLKTVVVAPVRWGTFGLDGNDKWLEMKASDFDKEIMTWTSETFDTLHDSSFKFAYNGGYKIELAADVKVNANLGEGMAPGAGDLKVDGRKNGFVSLTWTLAGGSIASGYSHAVKGQLLNVVDPRGKAVGFSGSALPNGWGDPAGETLAVYSAEESDFDESTLEGTFVWKIEKLLFEGGSEFKLRFDSAWKGVGEATIEGDAANFEGDGNFKVKTTKTYGVTISVAWNGASATGYTIHFAEVAE